MLDVGCGLGGTTERFVKELGADVRAIDLSPRMVELTRARGVDAQVGDVQQLPFEDGAFDCVFAGWMLYHVPDLERAYRRVCARAPARRTARRVDGTSRRTWRSCGISSGAPVDASS